jgi:hypothetical protein
LYKFIIQMIALKPKNQLMNQVITICYSRKLKENKNNLYFKQIFIYKNQLFNKMMKITNKNKMFNNSKICKIWMINKTLMNMFLAI